MIIWTKKYTNYLKKKKKIHIQKKNYNSAMSSQLMYFLLIYNETCLSYESRTNTLSS